MDQEATSVTPGEAPSDNASEDAAVAPPVRAGWPSNCTEISRAFN